MKGEMHSKASALTLVVDCWMSVRSSGFSVGEKMNVFQREMTNDQVDHDPRGARA
jgi:hypothetical protein